MSRRVLTRVGILFVPDRVNDRLRFGAPVAKQTLSPRCAVAFFDPGSLIGYVLWRANRHGTALWRVLVLRAARPGERVAIVPGVTPGAHLLLDAAGAVRAPRALALIDAVEAGGVDLAHVPESYWRTAHNRLAAGQAPRVYAASERAVLLRHGSSAP